MQRNFYVSNTPKGWNMTRLTTQRPLCLYAFFMVVIVNLFGCGGSEPEGTPGKSQSATFAFPAKLRDAPLPEGGTLRAVLVIDETETEMSISGNQAEARLENLRVGTREIKIYYAYDHPVYGSNIMLAEAVKNVSVTTGENTISFTEEDFNTSFDDDSDGVGNLDELIAGRNPGVVEDSEGGNEIIIQTTLPTFLNLSELPPVGTLRGALLIDDNPAREMLLDATTARVTIESELVGERAIGFNLIFDHPEFGNGIVIAESVVKNVALVTGENLLEFFEQDFTTDIDADDDGASNLTELVSGRNPLIGDDTTNPVASIEFPPSNSLTYDNRVLVRGTASDDASGIARVEVNEFVAITNDNFATWTAEVPLALGENSLSLVVVDEAGNRNTELVDLVTVRRVNPLRLVEPQGVAVDAAANRALVTDSALEAVVAVDLDSGMHTKLADIGVAKGIVLDPSGERALVVETESIVAVDLSTGSRSVFKSDITGISDIAVDPEGARLLLTDQPNSKLVELSLSGGEPIPTDRLAGGPLPAAIDVVAGQDRALVLSQGNIINSVDFLTFSTSPFVANPVSDPNPFFLPVDLAIDNQNSRALVVDRARRALFEVNLQTGEPSVFSNGRTPDGQNTFVRPLGIAIHEESNRAVIVDNRLNQVFGVDLASGARTVLSDHIIPNGNNPFLTPREITFDEDNQQLVLVDAEGKFVFRLDPITGERSPDYIGLPSDDETVSLAPVDIIAVKDQPEYYLLDAASNAVFLFRPGVRSVLSGQDAGVRFEFPRDFALDITGERLLVSDSNLKSITAIDRLSGARTVLSDNTISANNPFVYPSELVLDERNERLFVVDNAADTIFSVALNDGARTPIWAFDDGESDAVIGDVTDIAIDYDRDRVVVLDGSGRITMINLTTGVRTFVWITSSPNRFATAAGLYVDSEKNWAYVSDVNSRTVFVVDLRTGEPVIFSR